MDFDTFLSKVGEFGPYQRRHFCLLQVSQSFTAFATMSFVFIAANPEHWCRIPDMGSFTNLTLDERKDFALPRDQNGKFSKCSIYNLTEFGNDSMMSFNLNDSRNIWGSEYVVNSSDLSVTSCGQWDYDSSQFSNTIVKQWDLVCGSQWIATTTGACVGIGKLTGAFIFGIVSDKIGRRKCVIIAGSLACVVGVLGAFSPHVVVYSIAILIANAGAMGALQASFVWGMEIVGVSWRVFAGTAVQFFWVLGYVSLAGIAYMIRDWSQLQLALFCPMVLWIALVVWLSPESPRWLLRQGRVKEANVILKKLAETNGFPYEKDTMHIQTTEEKKQHDVTLADLSKSDALVVFTLANAVLWFSVVLLFYGISYNTSNLIGNFYLNYFISGVVEIPSYIVCVFLLRSRLGRRWSVFGGFALGGVALVLTVCIPAGHGWTVTTLSMIGKFAAAGVFNTVFIYTPEMYPTSYRNVALGVCSAVSRVAQMVAPYMALLGNVTAPEVPMVIFALFALLAAMATLLLPETNGVPLPETIEDVHDFQSRMLPCVAYKHGKTDGNCTNKNVMEFDHLLETKPETKDAHAQI